MQSIKIIHLFSNIDLSMGIDINECVGYTILFNINIRSNMGFFSTVYYGQGLEDNSCCSYAETIADVCRAPSRWVASDLFGTEKTYMIISYNENEVEVLVPNNNTEGWRKVLRVIVGLIFSIPGALMAVPFMALAYASEEIRLKHRVVANELTPEETKRLKELIDERQRLAKERQGCEPVSCLLFSICCLLCCMVCCRGN
jgi:hypothetical protein